MTSITLGPSVSEASRYPLPKAKKPDTSAWLHWLDAHALPVADNELHHPLVQSHLLALLKRGIDSPRLLWLHLVGQLKQHKTTQQEKSHESTTPCAHHAEQHSNVAQAIHELVQHHRAATSPDELVDSTYAEQSSQHHVHAKFGDLLHIGGSHGWSLLVSGMTAGKIATTLLNSLMLKTSLSHLHDRFCAR